MKHTEELIARLRDTASRGISAWGDLQQEAADELETLMNAVDAEPVAWGVFEGNLHDMYFTEEDAQELARLKGTHAEVRPLYTTPPLPEERNFCSRCGKRTADLTTVHTCTPPQEKNT